jgi:hypothetical protein
MISDDKVDWDVMWPKVKPVYERFGPSIAGEVFGIKAKRLTNAALRRGSSAPEGAGARVSREQRFGLIEAARAFVAAGCPDSRGDNLARHRWNQTVKTPGVEPGVKVGAGFKREAEVVGLDTAKRTVAPPFVDRRFVADPGHVGEFTLAWRQARGQEEVRR